MKNIRVVKTLAIAAVSTLTLLAGASQAGEWGHYQKVSAPFFPERSNFENRGIQACENPQAGYNIDARQQQQKKQIMHGLRSGKLSRHETQDLILEQKGIERMQHRFLADNSLSRGEWRKLDRSLDRAAQNIRAEKHDRDWR